MKPIPLSILSCLFYLLCELHVYTFKNLSKVQLIFWPGGIHFPLPTDYREYLHFPLEKVGDLQVQLRLISGSYLISLTLRLISTFHSCLIFYFPDLNSLLIFSKVLNLTMVLYSVKDNTFFFNKLSLLILETTDANPCPSTLANFVLSKCVCVCAYVLCVFVCVWEWARESWRER